MGVNSLAPYDAYIVSAGCWLDSLNESAFALTSYGHSCTKLLGVEKTPNRAAFILLFLLFFFLSKSLHKKIKSCNLKGFCWVHWEYNSGTEA